jgi:hypothetical protein
MKKLLCLIVFICLALLSCSAPQGGFYQGETRPLSLEELDELTTGLYIGGGMVYHESNQELTHFRSGDSFSIRLSRSVTRTVEGEAIEESYADDGTTTRTSRSSSTRSIEDVDSLLYGTVTVMDVSSRQIDLRWSLYDRSGVPVVLNGRALLVPGEMVDCNQDGVGDILWEAVPDGTPLGDRGITLLRFVSSPVEGCMTMYRPPWENGTAGAGGIITVNPDNLLVVSADSMQITDRGDEHITVQNDHWPLLSAYDFIHDKQEGAIMMVTGEPVIGSDSTIYSVMPCSMFDAYRVLSMRFSDSIDNLYRKYNSGSRYDIDLELPGINGTWVDDNASVTIQNSNTLGIFLDGSVSFAWDSINAWVELYLDGDFRLAVDADTDGSFNLDIPEYSIPGIDASFMIGPVPFSIKTPAGIGLEVYGNAEAAITSGLHFSGRLGFRQDIGVGVSYRKKTIAIGPWKKTVSIPAGVTSQAKLTRISEHELGGFDGNRLFDEPVMEIDMNGTCTIKPHLQFSPSISIGDIIGESCSFELSLPATLTAESIIDNPLKNPGVDLTFDVAVRAGMDLATTLDIKLWIFSYKKLWSTGQIILLDKNLFHREITL